MLAAALLSLNSSEPDWHLAAALSERQPDGGLPLIGGETPPLQRSALSLS